MRGEKLKEITKESQPETCKRTKHSSWDSPTASNPDLEGNTPPEEERSQFFFLHSENAFGGVHLSN